MYVWTDPVYRPCYLSLKLGREKNYYVFGAKPVKSEESFYNATHQAVRNLWSNR